MSSQVIFTRKEDPVINQLQDFSWKKVLLVRAIMKLPELETVDAKLIEVNQADQAYKLLKNRRVDAYINWLETDNYALLDFHYGQPVETKFVAFRFHLTPQGVELMEVFTQSPDCAQLMAQSIRPKELHIPFCATKE